MTRKTWIRAVCWLAMLAPILVVSTPPVPPPWHNFNVSGAVESRNGGSVEYYTVVLMGNPSNTWKILYSCSPEIMDEYGGSRDITITGNNGRFYLDVWSCERPESIAAAVVLPDTILFGSRVWRRDYDYQTFERTHETSDGGLCADDNEVTVIDGYMYHGIDSLAVPVP